MQPTTSDAEESHAMSCSSMRCTPAVYVYVFVPVACVSVCTLFAFSSQVLSFSFHTHMAAPLLVAGKGIDGPPRATPSPAQRARPKAPAVR